WRQIKTAAQEQSDAENRREPMSAMKQQHAEKAKQRETGSDPRAARDCDGNAGHDYQRGVANENPRERAHAASDGVGQRQRQTHFKEPAQMVWRYVGAAAAVSIAAVHVPNAVAVRQELVDRVT